MTIAVIGTGLFGTAIALNLSSAGKFVKIWSRRKNISHNFHQNVLTLFNGIKKFEERNYLKMTNSLDEALQNAEMLIMCKSSQETFPFLQENSSVLRQVPIVFCAKGIDKGNHLLQTQIGDIIKPKSVSAVLTGPSFATDIALEKPTALTVACRDHKIAKFLQSNISTPSLRLYCSSDVIGAQLGGALKNVIAIGCGMVQGKNLGESAKTALMTRGFSEMRRLGVSMGAQPETFNGLSGFGDLSLTCNSILSRNFNFGIQFVKNIENKTKTVEGYSTLDSTIFLMKKNKIEAPVIDSIARVLNGTLTIENALKELMRRPLRSE